MSSIGHLQKTFDLDGSSLEIGGQRWPAHSDAEFAVVDAAWCQFEWQHLRTSLTYTALDRSEKQQLACGYIFRSYKVGYHVECQTWVRADRLESGFDERFYQWFRNWVGEAWPFASLKVAWPGSRNPLGSVEQNPQPGVVGRVAGMSQAPAANTVDRATEEKLKLRREFRFGDMFFFYIAAIVVIDTIGRSQPAAPRVSPGWSSWGCSGSCRSR